MIRRIGRKLLFLFRRSRFNEEVEEEMRLHLALRAERLRNQQDGESTARRRFGNTTRLIEDSRDAWTWRWLEDALQDIRFATRLFGRRPVLRRLRRSHWHSASARRRRCLAWWTPCCCGRCPTGSRNGW
jgi:hypothetical protein